MHASLIEHFQAPMPVYLGLIAHVSINWRTPLLTDLPASLDASPQHGGNNCVHE